ncbi:ion transporter [Oceanococcus atlanticus]|uniref:ion transporter n=1 Tax=Oceanococcus atlanticus TaxID=1317117 RepID=UPI001F0A77A9|nr:ion transporter [Oceanococcus atlanticus]
MFSRQRLRAFLDNSRVQAAIVVLILINAVTLGLETSTVVMGRVGLWVHGLDMLILAVFTLEVTAKLYARGWGFWRDAWNVFDFLVVAVALVPSSGPFSVLRVLRLLRLVRMVPTLRNIVESLLHAVPGIVSIFGLLVLVFYVFAIIATSLFGQTFPEWFGSLGASLYTLFQVMTLESWSMGIARPVIEVHAWAWAFFVPFILVSSFTVLNLFIAVIVDAMQRIHEVRARFAEQDEPDTAEQQIAELQTQLEQMQSVLGHLQHTLEQERRQREQA